MQSTEEGTAIDPVEQIETRLNEISSRGEEVEITEEETEQEDSEAEEIEESEEETETEETEEQDEEEDTEEDSHDFETIDEIAEALGLESTDEFFKKYKTQIKVQGEVKDVDLLELKQGYQRDADYRQKTMALAEDKKVLESSYKEKNDELNQQLYKVTQALEALSGQFLNEYNNIDWDKLREEDPQRYAAKKVDYQERAAQLQQFDSQIAQQITEQENKAKEFQEQQTVESLQKEHELLLNALPEWNDAQVAETERTKLAEFLIGQGFGEDFFGKLTDHRHVLLARQAMKVADMPKKEAIAKKKLEKPIKLLKPSARQPRSDDDVRARQKERQAIKRNPNNSDLLVQSMTRRLNQADAKWAKR